MIDETQLPYLTLQQRDVLRRFAWFQADVEEVRTALTGIFEFELRRGARAARSWFRMLEPGIVITKAHLCHALDKKRAGEISEPDLVNWATLLLLNDAYVLDQREEDEIAEWLNNISLLLDAE